MKLIALAAALAFSGTAIAQDAPLTTDTAAQADKLGGYVPDKPLFSSGGSTAPAGAQVVFVPNTETPTEAFPPPKAWAKYPVCKKHQYNNCLQRSR